MKLLAFDTSTERLAVAVCKGQEVWVLNAPGGAQASAALLPAAQALLAQAGMGMHELQAIAFGRGPGAFTGLRTSCAVAQGLALGLGIPVLAICSLLIVAEDAWHQHEQSQTTCEVAVAMDARMGEVYAARWRRSGGTPQLGSGAWLVHTEPALYTAQALLQVWQPNGAANALHLLAGNAQVALAPALDALTAAAKFHAEHNRARALMRLAQAAWARGQAVDAALAQPLYLRDKVALTTQERASVRQTQA